MENEIPRGHLSTIILSSLLDGDKYGYEIIKAVEESSNGTIIIKQPSLYSSLKRMEEQNLISSYWRDSNIGGRRHYYRLTDLGRKQTLEWQKDLISSENYVNKILSKKDSNNNVNKTTVLKQESIFNTNENNLSISNKQQNIKQNKNEINNKPDSYIQFDLFDRSMITKPDEDEEYIIEKDNKNNNVLKSETKEEKPYNIADDLFKIRSKNSFSDFVKEESLISHNEAIIEDIKNNDTYSPISTNVQDKTTEINNNKELIDNKETIIENDKNFNNSNKEDQGVFITETIDPNNLPHVKKMKTTSSFNDFNFSTDNIKPNILKDNNHDIDKNENNTEFINNYYENYDNLKNYLYSKNFDLNIYKKENTKKLNKTKNQTKVNLLCYLGFNVLTIILALSLWLVNFNNNILSPILFLILPLLNLVILSYKYYKYRHNFVDSYKPTITTIFFHLILILIFSILIYAINLLLDFSFNNILKFSATFIFPIAILVIYLISTIINVIVQKNKTH